MRRTIAALRRMNEVLPVSRVLVRMAEVLLVSMASSQKGRRVGQLLRSGALFYREDFS